jgi:RNA polymerase subunit RPABC4/transcription elongation factor Spt4
MAKEKSCLNCKRIYVGDRCPNCGETPASDSFKGKIYVFNSKESEMANNMKIYAEGEFAIKTK